MIKLKQSVNNSKELVEYFQEIYKLQAKFEVNQTRQQRNNQK